MVDDVKHMIDKDSTASIRGREAEEKRVHFSLDLWMTLIRSHPEFKKKRAALFADFFSIKDVAVAFQAIRKIDVRANHINEVVGGNIKALELYMMALYEAGADVEKISIQQLNTFLSASEKLFFDYLPLPLDNSVEDGLKLLKDTGATLNILSNTGFIKGAVLRRYFEIIGWDKYFSFSIFSDETGFSKPSSNMFEAVWASVKAVSNNRLVNKQQVLHIGDNLRADYNGAISYGFQAFQIVPANGLFYQQLKSSLSNLGVVSATKAQF
jgi:putative hydrolase of the HAD superfamily